MADEHRKMNKQSTGTVPKVKCRNTPYGNERDSPRGWTNNLATDLQRLNLSEFARNSQRNHNYCTMNSALEEQRHPQVNGTITPNTSSTTSRRSSGTVPKCDNVPKYPERKHIEEKLLQIREYLQITCSLMSSMKNTDDQTSDPGEGTNVEQMIKDLRDSEAKLVGILAHMDGNELDGQSDGYAESNSHRNEPEDKVDPTNREMELLREQQSSLLSLQQKAENKLRDARQIQEKLMMAQHGNDLNSTSNQRDKKFSSVQDFDVAIKELEERSKRINEPRPSSFQDKLLADMDMLQNQIMHMHSATEDRNELIQVLDNRDTELQAQHLELHHKLSELQTKKQQVDQLVSQLQNLGEEGEKEEDVGVQVRRIVTMKDQLSKLKDMLEIVKTTETVMQNSNGSQEEQELACEICTKAENFLQKDGDRGSVDNNVAQRYLENAASLINDNRRKQVNTNAPSTSSERSVKSRTDKMGLQAELEAKKRELEDIMGKHKAGTSNLNHDVGADTKSEFSCSSFLDGAPAWAPNRFETSERYSSDECPEDVNEYSDFGQHNHSFTLPVLNYPRSKPDNARSGRASTEYISVDRQSSTPRTPDRNSTVPNRGCSNNDQSNKNQLQKQLELIRSVCDAMLDQQHTVRNNLTPQYSEPRQFASPHPMNVVVEPPFNGGPNYQGWMTNNTLQTQAFMLNTLNQCCQMLWLQQRELIALRQSVNQVEERIEPIFDRGPVGAPMNPPRTHPKTNQQVPAACSMPNLNQYNVLDPAYHNPCLNNANLNTMSNGEHINNSVLHAVNSVNANINPMPSQLWNGQALNNQVAPGNRANNYWDNFRSYSRQNLLSAKSNEDSFERTNNTLERVNAPPERTPPFVMMSTVKSNSEQTSAGTSRENTPHRRRVPVAPLRNSDTRNNAVPPDVLNVNHNKINEGADLAIHSENEASVRNPFVNNEASSNQSNASEELGFKEGASRRNEWHEEAGDEVSAKSKLFEELRDNVYKEVVTLISSNESRPHFLIQLFRDLQMISSDPLRLKILQSIQSIISHSLASKVIPENRQNGQVIPESFSLQSTVWPTKNARKMPHLEDGTELQNSIKAIIPYLNDHEEEVIAVPFLATLKQVLIDSESFQETVRDSVFKKHFANVLDEVLAQYLNKKVRDVKMHVIQSINDLLRGELSFIQLIQDTCPENGEELIIPGVFESPPLEGNAEIQNGDLAEADQSRIAEDDEEEEGAVGGFWELQLEAPAMTVSSEEAEPGEFQAETQFIKQGLDQVPTRLPTRSPSKDRPSSSRSDRTDFN